MSVDDEGVGTRGSSASELLEAYAEGRRAFRDFDLSHVDLRGAALGGIELQDAMLLHADLRDADLSDADLSGAFLWGSDLRGASFEGAALRGADFSGALMEGVDLRRSSCGRVKLGFCHLVGALLSGLDLERASLYGAHLIGARLDGAKLARGDLRTADFEGADLTGADLRAADLEGANLERADLRDAVLEGARLEGANLRGADLRGASLAHSSLESAQLDGARLDGANVEGAYIHGAGMPPDGLEGTIGVPKPEPVPAPTGIGMRGLAPGGAEAFREEKVLLGASAPRQAKTAERFTARFVAHAEGLEDEVEALLEGLSPSSAHHLGAGKTHWARDAEVQVVLGAEGLEVDEPLRTFRWDGEYEIVDFDVRVPEKTGLEKVILAFDALVGGVPAGRVRLDVAITGETSDERHAATQHAFTSGFASYASDDRLRVLDRVGAMRQLTGIDIFLDCISLRAGERWEQRLYEEIERRDLFFLFWSRSARESEWVEREWTAALETKGEEAMQIQPLDPPAEAPPPPELGHLHFNDVLALVRSGLARERPDE